MIRLLFRVTGKDGASTLHSAEVHGQKSALLLDTPNVEIIGFEDCREINPRISISFAEQIALAKKTGKAFREIAGTLSGGVSATWKNDSDGGIPIPPDLAPEIERAFKDSERPDVVYTPSEPEILCGGAEDVRDQKIPSPESVGLGGTAMDYRDLYESKEIQPAEMSPEEIGKAIADEISERRKRNEDPRVLHGNGLGTKLWLLLRQNGEFVKSTTEEGGESYIACTSLDEAQKVAEQQKIYDIDCVPHRVF